MARYKLWKSMSCLILRCSDAVLQFVEMPSLSQKYIYIFIYINIYKYIG